MTDRHTSTASRLDDGNATGSEEESVSRRWLTLTEACELLSRAEYRRALAALRPIVPRRRTTAAAPAHRRRR